MRSVPQSTFDLVLLLLLVAPSYQAQTVRSGSNSGRSTNAWDKNSADVTIEEPRSESSESVDVGGVTLRLGMAADDAVHRLCEGYKLKEITSPGAAGSQWLVQGRHQVIATVYFLAGRLASISKDWMAAASRIRK